MKGDIDTADWESPAVIRESCLSIARSLKFFHIALAGVAQWTVHWPANLRVTSSIPSQGTCLGFGPGPQ